MDRWLLPAPCKARTVCSNAGLGGTSGNSIRSALGSEPGCHRVGGVVDNDVMVRPDKKHQKFEGANQGQGGPRADQGTNGPVVQAVRQVGTNRCQDADG